MPVPALAASRRAYVTSSLSATVPLAVPSDTDAHVVLAADLMSLLEGPAPTLASVESSISVPSPTSRASTGPENSAGLRVGMIVFLAVGFTTAIVIFWFFYLRRMLGGLHSWWRHDKSNAPAVGTSSGASSGSSSDKTEESVELGVLPDAHKSESSVAPLLPVHVLYSSDRRGHYDGGEKKLRGTSKAARQDNAALVGARQAAACMVTVSLDDEKHARAPRRSQSKDISDLRPTR